MKSHALTFKHIKDEKTIYCVSSLDVNSRNLLKSFVVALFKHAAIVIGPEILLVH